MELSLKEAFRIAVEVHGDQRDKSGEPYLFHVMRVAAQMDTDEERVVAILHDVIEDFVPEEGDIGQTLALVSRIYELYGPNIGNAVEALTKGTDVPYMDYIRRLSTNPLAVKVKLADLEDNSNPERLESREPKEAVRLYAKYAEAYAFLFNQRAPSRSEELIRQLAKEAAIKEKTAEHVTPLDLERHYKQIAQAEKES